MVNLIKYSALKRWHNSFSEKTSQIPFDANSLIIKSALCGFIAGDGSLQIRKSKGENFSHYQLDFFADDKEMLKTYVDFIEKLYKKTPSIGFRDNMYVPRLSQKFIVLDLLKESKFGIYTWEFPNKLFKIDGAIENWLRAYFSAEGYVGDKVIKIQSVNIKSIKRVKTLLSHFNIKSNYYEYMPKNKNHSKVGMLFITERKSREIYFKKIGFWHARKTQRLKESLGL